MELGLVRRVLRLRRELGRRDTWTRSQLLAHQDRAMGSLREHAYRFSPFYRRFHKGLTGAPLSELPVLTKAMLMEHFDELVTDRNLRLADVEAHLRDMRSAERLRGRYYAAATAGTTGRRGVFVWDVDEWAAVLASYNRGYAWAGERVRLTRRTKIAVVGSTTPWHQSALVGATVNGPLVPALGVDSGWPMEDIVQRLDRYRPHVLVGYASMVRLLAAEQLDDRLHISPRQTVSTSEVLTAATRRRAAAAWGREPVNVYAATETAGVAADCEYHAGLHLFEDLVVTEVVDDNRAPVPPGDFGAGVLVSVLFSRTLPLIRYEMSDSVRLSAPGPCPCGRPFARIDGIQGREQEALQFPRVDGGHVTVQPEVFHRVMDTVPAGGWQVLQQPEGLTVLLAGLASGFDPDAVRAGLRRQLERLGAEVPPLQVRLVDAIPRTALGKAPLIRSALDHADGR